MALGRFTGRARLPPAWESLISFVDRETDGFTLNDLGPKYLHAPEGLPRSCRFKIPQHGSAEFAPSALGVQSIVREIGFRIKLSRKLFRLRRSAYKLIHIELHLSSSALFRLPIIQYLEGTGPS